MRLRVRHSITTRFDPPRRRYVQSHRLTPGDCDGQAVVDWSVTLSEGVAGAVFTDGAGDRTATLSTPGEVSELTVTVAGTVDTFDTLGVLRGLKEKVPPATYLMETRMIRPDAGIVTLAREAVSGIAEDKPLDRAHALAQAVTSALTETRDAQAALQPATEALEAGCGGAADHAHLLIAASHALDMPARFVCGYLVRNAVALQMQSGGEEDPAPAPVAPWAGHVWAELWVEGLGWVGFDCVNECCPDERFIRLCSGRDAFDAAPLRGVGIGSGAEALEVALDVEAAEQ